MIIYANKWCKITTDESGLVRVFSQAGTYQPQIFKSVAEAYEAVGLTEVGKHMVYKVDPAIIRYARKCFITGKGMNSGWVFGDGDFYIKEESDVVWLLERRGSNLRSAYYDGICYYTEWDEIDEEEWFDVDGNQFSGL